MSGAPCYCLACFTRVTLPHTRLVEFIVNLQLYKLYRYVNENVYIKYTEIEIDRSQLIKVVAVVSSN